MAEKYKKELALLNIKKNSLIKNIQSLHNLSIQLSEGNCDIFEFEVRFDELKSDYESFNKCESEIFKILIAQGLDNELVTEESDMEKIKNMYFTILATHRKFEKASKPEEEIVSKPISQSQVRLPQIELPQFGGNIKDWPHFKDLFVSLVHDNKTLPAIEKFHYLVSCLKSEPLCLVKTLPLTSQNYNIVWEQLVARYDNKRLLAAHYFDEILNSKGLTKESPKKLRQLIDLYSENVTALKDMNFPVDYGDFILCHLLLLRLDLHTRQLFERKYSTTEFPSFNQLLTFLNEHCKSLEACQLFTVNSTSNIVENDKTSHNIDKFTKRASDKLVSFPLNTFASNFIAPSCLYCNDTHPVYKCQKFIVLPVSQKRDFIKSQSACFNCLSSGHSSKSCKSRTTCKKCFKLHHTMLHDSFNNVSGVSTGKLATQTSSYAQCNNGNSESTPPKMSHSVSQETAQAQHTVLLGTAAIQIMDSSGEYNTFRALLDPGSQVSFITEECVQKLSLTRQKYTAPIMGVSQTVVETSKGIVNCCIKPRFKNQPCLQTDAVVLKSITAPLPTSHLHTDVKRYFKNFDLADPYFDVPGKIDFLIGADLFSEVFDGGRRRTPKNYPTAFSSIFGWILLGKSITSCLPPISLSHLTLNQSQSLETSLKRFWEIEEPPVKNHLSHDELRAEELFEHSHSRDQNGRYVVKLPFLEEHPDFGDTYYSAFQSFTRLEKRLSCNETFKNQYTAFMNEYEVLGHMTLCDPKVKPEYFIPHHGVFKTKIDSDPQLRVVFNASAKSTNGKSLNDLLLTGPKLQNDICNVLSNFRLHPIVFTADICKMYRQITIHPDHQVYQAILWRKSPDLALKTYLLNTVTYGVSSAPFLAIRTLHQLAFDEGKHFPLASQSLLNDIYVDDILVGGQTLDECASLKSDLIKLLSLGGFELKKWSSNNPDLLSDIPEANQEVNLTYTDSETKAIKVLGIKWNPKSDTFMYDVNISNSKATKRNVLSILSSIFDPLGWVTPVIFCAKKLMQSIWTSGISWDCPLPENLNKEWQSFVDELSQLQKLRIPRQILPYGILKIQLHGFCDASVVGYGACVYIRSESTEGKIDVKLISAKSKVAPLKTISIPKLELCATLLLAKLLQFHKEALKSKVSNLTDIFAWSDSTIALSWIRTSPHLLKTFVANRVALIQDLVEPSCWNHVPSMDNPADCSSRGILPFELLKHNLWWSGPAWLFQKPNYWPVATKQDVQFDFLPEMKTATLTNLTTNNSNSQNCILERFSSLIRLKRVTAWCIRFIKNCRSSTDQRTCGSLSTQELNASLTVWIKWTQNHVFSDELKLLKSGKPCKPELQRLDPFIDQEGMIRVGGRLRHSHLDYNSRHPILLSKNCLLTTLLINHYHVSYFHLGPRNLQCLIQRNFWILSARNAIRKLILRCVKCCKLNGKPLQPKMADLPAFRINPCRPFLKIGVDYGGPFLIKSEKIRKPQIKKAYLCLFICMTTKALHLEVVSDLTTDAFLAAFNRLIARRGICTDVFSDQGTNFVGASSVLHDLNKFWKNPTNSTKILTSLANKGITWHFNPPSAPHFGGIWEAGIKSAKFHLSHVIGEQILTFEEITTLFAQIEAVLNSRPLCPLSTDPDEIDVLTPGHFIIGEPLVSLPQPGLTHIPQNRLSRWQLISQAKQHFWKRWSSEYLHVLQQRSKWTIHKVPIKIGDIVIIKDSNITPQNWRIGRVINTFPGKDDVVRVVRLRTSTGEIVRPVTKLCPLPVD